MALLLVCLQQSNASNLAGDRYQQWTATKLRKQMGSAPTPASPKPQACPVVIGVDEGGLQAHLETHRRLMVFFVDPHQSTSLEMRSSYCALAKQADGFAVAEVDVVGARQWSAELGAELDRTWLDFTPAAAWLEIGRKPVRVRLSGGHFATRKVPAPSAEQLLHWIKMAPYPAVHTFASYAELEDLSNAFGTVLVGLFAANNSAP